MIENLFRGKRTDNGKLVEGCLLIDYITGQYFIHRYGDSVNESDKVGEEGCLRFLAFEVDPSTICQCTGLPDKNRKKIWENDIVIYLDENTGKYKTDIINWNKTYAAFCRLHRSEMGLQYLIIDECIANKCEVIGNVFDNPELMEGE